MAQIKNIKKPGDLIRGAKVGVAGLDKTGNVIGIPGIVLPAVSAADAGKVPMVGIDGIPNWAYANELETVDISSDMDTTNRNVNVTTYRAYKTGRLIVIRLSIRNDTDDTISAPTVGSLSGSNSPDTVAWYASMWVEHPSAPVSQMYIGVYPGGLIQSASFPLAPGDSAFGVIVYVSRA